MAETKTFTITNTGAYDVQVISAEIDPPSSEFSASPSQTLPHTLSASQSMTVDVTASSTVVGPVSSNLVISHNAFGSPYTAHLSANFIAEPGGSIEFPFSTAGATIPVIPSYSLGDFTFEFWLRVKSSPANQGFGRVFDNNSATGFDINIRSGTPTLWFECSAINSTFANPLDTIDGITLNTFIHYAFVREGSTGRIFINGVADRVRTIGSGTFTPASPTISVGSKGAELASGYISDWRLWSVARSQAQIAANYQNRLIGNEAGLVAYYKFNQTDGDFIDSTGNNVAFTNNGCSYSAVSPPPF